MFVLGADKGGSCPALSCSGLLLSPSKILPFMNVFSADSNSIKTLFIYFDYFFLNDVFVSGADWGYYLKGRAKQNIAVL